MADAQNPRINEQLEQLDTTLQAIDTTLKGIITDLGGEVEQRASITKCLPPLQYQKPSHTPQSCSQQTDSL